MSSAEVETLTVLGVRLLTTKWFSVSMYSLWIFDYFLTLGDEVNYGWSGGKGWVFVLFILNRYIPALHIIYKGLIFFDYTISLCEKTRWEINTYTLIVACLAQTTIALRLYAVTGRNKLYGAVFITLITGQFGGGLWYDIVSGRAPIQNLPPINLDAFRVCAAASVRSGAISFVSIAIAFDLAAFFSIIIAANGPRYRGGYPGMPSLLQTILRDATVYFVLMFVCQIVLLFFLLLAPVQLQLLPGITHAIFLPMMSCRLMLSLKRAASEPTGLWSLSGERWRSAGSSSISFRNPQTPLDSHEISPPFISTGAPDIELGSIPQLPQYKKSPQ